MDRPVDPTFKRNQLAKRLATLFLGGAFLVYLFLWLPGWIRPSLEHSRIRAAQVEWGAVEASITAAGTVVPEFEQVMVSPTNTRVVRILERPGTLLSKGQPIMELDLNKLQLAVEKLTEQLALKKNRQAQLGQDMEKLLNDLGTRIRIKGLELENLREKTRQHRQLLTLGAISKEYMRQAELNEERAGLELEKLEKDVDNIRESTRTRLEGLELEMRILEKEREEARRRLERAQIRADRDGVLTWVLPEEGASVGQGEVVARIADLNSFRVDATVSDLHAGHLSTGMPVRVRIDDEKSLRGSITRVLPAIENGIVKFEASLEDKGDTRLRTNLRVDVYVVTARKDRVLRIRKGPFINGGAGERDVFVIRGDVAVKTSVLIGISSFDYYEVEEGLLEGDEVVISDMSDYEHMEEIKIQ